MMMNYFGTKKRTSYYSRTSCFVKKKSSKMNYCLRSLSFSKKSYYSRTSCCFGKMNYSKKMTAKMSCCLRNLNSSKKSYYSMSLNFSKTNSKKSCLRNWNSNYRYNKSLFLYNQQNR